MKCTSFVLVVALLVQVLAVPCLAQQDVILQADKIDYSKLQVGIFVEVTYRVKENEKLNAKGYIKAVEDDSFTIGRGQWTTKIKNRNVITLKIKGFDLSAFSPGNRIRLTAPSIFHSQFVATLAKLDADSLVVETEDGRALVLPVASINRFEVSPGEKSRAKAGAVIGLLTGATAGSLFIDLTNKRTVPSLYGVGTETRLSKRGLARFLLLCSTSTFICTMIGARIKNERWKQVPLPVHMGIAPEYGLTLSVSFAF